jgi:protein-S-isoprenylcysteine O-methyltransferase Ste14
MTTPTSPRPKLLKARQFHSRIFAVVAIALFCCIAPSEAENSLARLMMVWGGYMLVIVGAFGRVYCSAFIGGRKNKSVMRDGPFSVVRNPLYVFSFLATIGIGLQSGMWVVTGLLVIAFAIYYPFVVAKEEQFLRHKFDESYEAYLREVPRWIPNLKLWQEPQEAATMPKFIRRTMGDAMVFFLPFPAFAVISALQAHQILPVWLTLP